MGELKSSNCNLPSPTQLRSIMCSFWSFHFVSNQEFLCRIPHFPSSSASVSVSPVIARSSAIVPSAHAAVFRTIFFLSARSGRRGSTARESRSFPSPHAAPVRSHLSSDFKASISGSTARRSPNFPRDFAASHWTSTNGSLSAVSVVQQLLNPLYPQCLCCSPTEVEIWILQQREISFDPQFPTLIDCSELRRCRFNGRFGTNYLRLKITHLYPSIATHT